MKFVRLGLPKFTTSTLGAPLYEERYELRLFRDELREWPERYRPAKYLFPLIDKRLLEIEADLKRLGLPESDPVEQADKKRDYALEVDAQIKAQRE